MRTSSVFRDLLAGAQHGMYFIRCWLHLSSSHCHCQAVALGILVMSIMQTTSNTSEGGWCETPLPACLQCDSLCPSSLLSSFFPSLPSSPSSGRVFYPLPSFFSPVCPISFLPASCSVVCFCFAFCMFVVFCRCDKRERERKTGERERETPDMLSGLNGRGRNKGKWLKRREEKKRKENGQTLRKRDREREGVCV